MNGSKFGLHFELADNSKEYKELIDNIHSKSISPDEVGNLILNLEDFRKYYKSKNLNLDAETLSKFEDSLLFLNGGIASFNLTILAEKLTVTQFQELLAHLGFSLKYFEDRPNSRCERDPSTDVRHCIPDHTGASCNPAFCS